MARNPNGNYSKGMLLMLTLAIVGVIANHNGLGTISGEGTGSGASGCGGDMSDYQDGDGFDEYGDEYAADGQADDNSSDEGVEMGFGASPQDERAEGYIERPEPSEYQQEQRDGLDEDMAWHLEQALEATSHEERQGELRAYHKANCAQDTTEAKVQGWGILADALAPAGENGTPMGVPNGEGAEAFCDRIFEDEFVEEAGDEVPVHLVGRTRHVRCNWWSAGLAYFRSGGAYGNYCGKGQSNNCANNNKAQNNNGYGGATVCADGGLDKSCSKHDAGSYSRDVWGVMTLNWCEVDRNFKNERAGTANGFHDGVDSDHNALNGANCLFGVLPCLRYESYSYWGWCSKWWGGYPCRKSTTGVNTKWSYGNYPSGGCQGSCYK
jgi:hypothetical protein